MINLAIIGAGRHSRLHHGAAAARLRDRLGRVVVADLDAGAAEDYSRSFGLDGGYGDASEMLRREKPDGVIAVTPEAVTGKVFLQLIPSGLPLLIEKPFGENLAETERLCRAAEESRARVMLSFNRRFSPVCSRIKQLLAGRQIRHIRGAMFRHARFDRNFLTATAIHLIDTVHFFAGEGGIPAAVNASRSGEGSVPALSALLTFPSGITGELLIDSDCGFISECYEIIGRDFRIVADYFRGYTLYESGAAVDSFELPPETALEEREGADAELAVFIDGVERGVAAFPAGPRDGLAAARVAHALAAAAERAK